MHLFNIIEIKFILVKLLILFIKFLLNPIFFFLNIIFALYESSVIFKEDTIVKVQIVVVFIFFIFIMNLIEINDVAWFYEKGVKGVMFDFFF